MCDFLCDKTRSPTFNNLKRHDWMDTVCKSLESEEEVLLLLPILQLEDNDFGEQSGASVVQKRQTDSSLSVDL